MFINKEGNTCVLCSLQRSKEFVFEETESRTGHSIFGIALDRKHELEWLFHQEKPPFAAPKKSMCIPEMLQQALAAAGATTRDFVEKEMHLGLHLFSPSYSALRFVSTHTLDFPDTFSPRPGRASGELIPGFHTRDLRNALIISLRGIDPHESYRQHHPHHRRRLRHRSQPR